MIENFFSRFVHLVDQQKLHRFYSRYSDAIYTSLVSRLEQETPTPYLTYLLNDLDGLSRIRIYIAKFGGAIIGQLQPFLDDQKHIGYIRAKQGYQLKDVYDFKLGFQEMLWECITDYNGNLINSNDQININDILFFYHLVDYSNYFLSFSFLQTREEIIQRRANQIEELHRYAARVVSVFDEEQILAYANQAVHDIFGIYGSFLINSDTPGQQNVWNQTRLVGIQVAEYVVEKLAVPAAESLTAFAINADNRDGLLKKFFDYAVFNDFKAICVPIRGQNENLRLLLFVHNSGTIFEFGKVDMTLLLQLSFFTGAVLSNYWMISELGDKKTELARLLRRLISLQEAERKKIAADIHDTVTQALTGIGYKVLFCQELQNKEPARLGKELKHLTVNINSALSQCRKMIVNLRPSILDDFGIVAALKKIISDFREETLVSTRFRHTNELQLPSDIGIALFRILQESLNNIKRHAQASHVTISLFLNENRMICLDVEDDGLGFDLQYKKKRSRNSGFGLLTMRERAEDLGGRLEVVSRKGDGCHVTATIPLQDAK
ncbi:MAG: sensor histidine kinase [Desulfatirhabdiaceae bacterium]